jgi:hypothetical protein
MGTASYTHFSDTNLPQRSTQAQTGISFLPFYTAIIGNLKRI